MLTLLNKLKHSGAPLCVILGTSSETEYCNYTITLSLYETVTEYGTFVFLPLPII